MRALLRTLAGRTVLLSTHNLAEASALCSRVIILSHGGVVAEDTAARLGRRLEGAGRLVARIDGPPDAVAQALAALPGVVGVERGAADGQSGVSFVVLASDPEPVQRRLAAAIVAGGWTLLEVRAKPPTPTMRLLAEGRRLGTLELLLTYPLRDGAIVAAKLGACLVVVATLLAGTLAYPLLVFRVEPFALEPLAAAYLGLLLFAGVCASYGLFVSSLTDSQVLAGFLTALPLLLLWLLSWNEASAAIGALPVVRA